ncbi:PBSX family phage terminase large subunit [Weissella ceti]|uniref:PBSX family phage terminase large subunit n=1 Tax=Weissella ceti TaxID=759620 RepID=A0ABT3E465_9LACO|nr:PBSX family phage terminase large subunit [Weissella ceti]MCW0953201.1 PBSX family phage terminase large subunit [Weissella ceti]QVK12718.1 PBSX family phage terminase large subunit [Weissella ceti]
MEVRLSALIAPSFFDAYLLLKSGTYTHWWFKGGRGSTKSSFISVLLIMGVMADPDANVVVLRQVADTLRGSVFEQYQWAIDKLGVSHLWKTRVNPLELEYKPTGQRILFKGADKPAKLKSIKFKRGFAKYIHYEEVAEFKGSEAIRSINQSIIRGGQNQMAIYTYNPPKSATNWVNQYVTDQATREDTYVHSSTYLSVPPEWLGEAFITEAEETKRINPDVYAHEYLGEVVGTGAEVFHNITSREITDDEHNSFDKIYRGLDFGFAADPLAYVEWYFDKARGRLYAMNEVYGTGLSNERAVSDIKRINGMNDLVIADSAEPRTIAEFREKGMKLRPARKGPGSVDHGIKWLQDLNEIIIDPRRTPNIHREFTGYELEVDANGNLRGQYPDKNNHSIDSTRYAVEQLLKPRTKMAW